MDKIYQLNYVSKSQAKKKKYKESQCSQLMLVESSTIITKYYICLISLELQLDVILVSYQVTSTNVVFMREIWESTILNLVTVLFCFCYERK